VDNRKETKIQIITSPKFILSNIAMRIHRVTFFHFFLIKLSFRNVVVTLYGWKYIPDIAIWGITFSTFFQVRRAATTALHKAYKYVKMSNKVNIQYKIHLNLKYVNLNLNVY